LGFRTIDEMVGHSECLKQVSTARSWKAQLIDLSPVLYKAHAEYGTWIPWAREGHSLPEAAPVDPLPSTLDATLLIPYTERARTQLKPLKMRADITNVNRCVGTLLGSQVTKAHPEGLPDDLVTVECKGSGGMSFGAFVPKGVTLSIAGEANDYFGKGLSGGILSVAPSSRANYRPEENVAVGNVAFYGATSGKGFVNGLAGQRFAVRNSGATLVVEGCGNNGCEYMTGGTVLVLGEVGLNFAAGMTGGVAYVYDAKATFTGRCNKDMVNIEDCEPDDIALIHALLEEHVERTASPLAIMMLYRFEQVKKHFVKVMPKEYEHALKLTVAAEARGANHDDAVELAFEAMRRGE
ncbi:MAG: glutamate synthase subunit alpha, partial [Coriobacteriales bacterium]